MEADIATSVLWIILPLCSDLSSIIRMLHYRFQKNIPDLVEAHASTILPSADDNFFLPRNAWTDDLQENTSLQISQKQLSDINVEFELLNPHPFIIDLAKETDNLHLPTISKELMERFRIIAESLTCPLNPEIQEQVFYHLNKLKQFDALKVFILLIVANGNPCSWTIFIFP